MKITKIYWGILAFVCLTGLTIALYNLSSLSADLASSAGDIIHNSKTNKNKIVRVKPDPTTNITGIVRSIDDGSITISTISPDPMVTEEPITRIVRVSPDTKYIAVVAKTPAEIKADLKTYNKEKKNDVTAPPPSPMREIPIDPSDIKLTMVITAFAEKDVSVAPSFDASKITFQTF
jgi:hypothetical protein